jgi:hypothetical protein
MNSLPAGELLAVVKVLAAQAFDMETSTSAVSLPWQLEE